MGEERDGERGRKEKGRAGKEEGENWLPKWLAGHACLEMNTPE